MTEQKNTKKIVSTKNKKMIIISSLVALVLAVSTVLVLLFVQRNGEDENINIVLANATIPPLMASLDVFNTDDETYMWYGRAETFSDVEALEEEVTLIAEAGEEEVIGIPNSVITETKKLVNNLAKNKNATFDFYVTDYGIKAALRIFAENQISEDRYNVYLLEDGTGSYAQFNSVDNYDEAGAYPNFESKVTEINNLYDNAWNGDIEWEAGNIQNWDLSFAYATRDNVQYWLQNPESLISADPEMNALLFGSEAEGKINLVEKATTDMFNALPKQKQARFRKTIMDATAIDPILDNENGKDTLVIMGTGYPYINYGFAASENYTIEGVAVENPFAGEFEGFMDSILEAYGDTYNIAFKPHPAWAPVMNEDGTIPENNRWGLATSGRMEFLDVDGNDVLEGEELAKAEELLAGLISYLDTNSIEVLPAQTPAETILWTYPGLMIGGYDSSLYLSANPAQIAFFVKPEGNFSLSVQSSNPTFFDETGVPPILWPSNIQSELGLD